MMFLVLVKFPGKPEFGGMGELNGEELEYLFDNVRLRLSEYDFIIAGLAWQVYIQQDLSVLSQFIEETTFWGSLHSLKNALQAHLKRLQTNNNGLNDIEQKLLDIYNSVITVSRDICTEFWKTDKIYGLGDLEIRLYLERLRGKGLI